MRAPKDYILIFAKGLCMGATEVVHGVSGSTMALILGVYNELIHSLKSVDRNAISLLFSGKFSEFAVKTNAGFLSALLFGVGVSLLTLTRLISYWVQTSFISITALFFGLILISGVLLLRKVRKWSFRPVLAFFSGIVLNYLLTIVSPLDSGDHVIFAFIAGACAGFVLIFPGISGAFILIVIGKYQYIVTSFSQLNVPVIVVFFFGCLLGLWVASRFMYRLLADYYSTTVALLAGLMIGALNKLWPWRKVIEYATNGNGEQIPAFDESILPWRYLSLTGKDPQVFLALLMMAVGVLIVVMIEKIAAGLKTKF